LFDSETIVSADPEISLSRIRESATGKAYLGTGSAFGRGSFYAPVA
jgi:hypothetical protein